MGAIGVEVWGQGRGGAPNPDLAKLVLNVDPQHGGGCWVVDPERTGEVQLPTDRGGWFGSAAATVFEHLDAYREAAALYPAAPIWCPRWDADALAAAILIADLDFDPRAVDLRSLRQLDAFDSSASLAEILVVVPPGYELTHDGLATAETVGDTAWGAVHALLRAGEHLAAVEATTRFLWLGYLGHETTCHPVVEAWEDERRRCANHVAAQLEVHHGVACVTDAPQGAWPYALAHHDWAVLTFQSRGGRAHSVAGSRRLPLEQRAARIAALNERLTKAEELTGGSAHWVGAAGITGSRDAPSVLTPAHVAEVIAMTP